MKRLISGIIAMLLLISMLALASDIQLVRASGGIYIRADGSIDPPGTPILTTDNVTYTFTDNVYVAAIIIERDNIVIDGNNFMLDGSGSAGWVGFDISERSNVTIKNTEIRNFGWGVHLKYSSENTLTGNCITGTGWGIYCEHSSDNTISENNVTTNGDNIDLLDSSNDNFIFENYIANSSSYGLLFGYTSSTNKIYHNNFINNSVQAYCWLTALNIWDDGYPSGGNYWSDYNGTDSNHDGIGDTAYIIDGINIDHYPLMKPWTLLQGDVNDDGIVNILDVVKIASIYGCKRGESNWNPFADLAPPYGKIDILDLVTCTVHYGQKYP